jgi:hypothetical protein
MIAPVSLVHEFRLEKLLLRLLAFLEIPADCADSCQLVLTEKRHSATLACHPRINYVLALLLPTRLQHAREQQQRIRLQTLSVPGAPCKFIYVVLLSLRHGNRYSRQDAIEFKIIRGRFDCRIAVA